MTYGLIVWHVVPSWELWIRSKLSNAIYLLSACQEMFVCTELVGNRVQLLELAGLGLEKTPGFFPKKLK